MFSNNNSIGKLQRKSGNILSIFTSTITDLHAVNSEINGHLETREEEIKRLQDEHLQLKNVKADNLKVIEKISKIFE